MSVSETTNVALFGERKTCVTQPDHFLTAPRQIVNRTTHAQVVDQTVDLLQHTILRPPFIKTQQSAFITFRRHLGQIFRKGLKPHAIVDNPSSHIIHNIYR